MHKKSQFCLLTKSMRYLVTATHKPAVLKKETQAEVLKTAVLRQPAWGELHFIMKLISFALEGWEMPVQFPLKKAKAEHFLNETSQNLNNPRLFWETIESLSRQAEGIGPAFCTVKDSNNTTNKPSMLNLFIATGSLFDTAASSVYQGVVSQFTLRPVTVTEEHETPRLLDSRQTAAPDNLEPHFLKIAADFIALPLTCIFNVFGLWWNYSWLEIRFC